MAAKGVINKKEEQKKEKDWAYLVGLGRVGLVSEMVSDQLLLNVLLIHSLVVALIVALFEVNADFSHFPNLGSGSQAIGEVDLELVFSVQVRQVVLGVDGQLVLLVLLVINGIFVLSEVSEGLVVAGLK